MTPLRFVAVLLLAIAGCSEPVPLELCAPDRCAEPDTVCVDTPEGPRCECREGTTRVGDACVVPTECTEATCSGRGSCSVLAGEVVCACDATFGGPLCERCADGLHDDGAGGCTADPCVPDPCGSDRLCIAEGSEARCECPAGMHDEAGACVPDTTCTPTTCSGHGECTADGTMLSCACEPGHAGRFCDACDLEAGYHDDGAGGCTTDPCVPSPCTAPNRSACSADGAGGAVCACDAGYHLELDACVPDESCAIDSCAGHGACSVVDGLAICACDPGWAMPDCAACASGHHDDGAGGCTTDPCAPSPCTIEPHRSVCTVSGAGTAVCSCDPGYHDDGAGGCTTDPCVPDPCAALGQACRVAGGAAECHTPPCGDGNPCTLDEFVGGACRSTPLANGTSCSTTVCTTGQTCTAGVCGGGTPVRCDDANPCTADSCDPSAGCAYASDDSLVPSDGLACTIDVCAGGVASHAPSDGVCDDARWCTGVERCMPGTIGADARGCVATAVPTPPAPSTTCGRYDCNESAMRFDLVAIGAGTSCDDAIACTSGDACDGSGACRGAVSSDCGACAGATWSSGVDVSPARIRGRLLYRGSTSFPSAADTASVSIYLRSRSTGTLSRLEGVSFSGTAEGGRYPVRSYSASDDRTIDLPVLPGVYDVVYRRWSSMPVSGLITSHSPTDDYAHADHVLIDGLVIGPGLNALDVDVAPVRVTGSLRYAGGTTFPSAADTASVSIYLRSRSTGTLSRLEGVSFSGTAESGRYPVRSYSASDDRTIDLPLLPGAYDVVYRRWSSMPVTGVITSHSPTDSYAHADHVLLENVTIGPGATSLDVDVAPVRLTGALRYEGGTSFPSAADTASVSIYLRSRSTGTLSRLEGVSFSGTAEGGRYPVRSYSASDDRTIDLPLLPGRYDVVYRRWSSMPVTGVITSHSPTDSYAHADHVLLENVTIGPGATSLDVEVAPVRVSGALVYGGSATFPSAADTASVSIYLRSRSTGTLSRLEGVSFSGTAESGRYPVRSYSASDDRTIDLPLLPGTYDVVYRRWSSMPVTGVITSHSPTDSYAHADHVLLSGVTIPRAPTTLDVEVAPVRLTGALRYEGGTSFPSAADTASVSIYLRSRSTGTLSRLEGVSFSGTAESGRYPVRSYSASDDRAIDLPILPGRYDVVYRRWSSMPVTGVITSHSPTDSYAHADHVLLEDVVVGPGATSLDVEVAPIRLGGTLRYATGTTFPSAADTASVSLYLRSRSTGTLSRLEGVSFSGTAVAGRYPVRSYSASDDRIVDLPVLAGDYDLVYRRWSSMPVTGIITSHSPTDDYAHADHHLQACVAVR